MWYKAYHFWASVLNTWYVPKANLPSFLNDSIPPFKCCSVCSVNSMFRWCVCKTSSRFIYSFKPSVIFVVWKRSNTISTMAPQNSESYSTASKMKPSSMPWCSFWLNVPASLSAFSDFEESTSSPSPGDFSKPCYKNVFYAERIVRINDLKDLTFPFAHVAEDLFPVSSPSINLNDSFSIFLTPGRKQCISSIWNIAYISTDEKMLTRERLKNLEAETALAPLKTLKVFLFRKVYFWKQRTLFYSFCQDAALKKAFFGVVPFIESDPVGRWNLFGLLFFWQLKHFLSQISATWEAGRKWTKCSDRIVALQ